MNASPTLGAGSACAKIILLGEHAVVYNQPALAVSVSDVRAHATARHALPHVGLRLSAPALSPEPIDTYTADDRAQALLLAAREAALLSGETTTPPDLALTLTSAIPMARGMGSSAAVCAALARAVCDLYGRPLDAAALSALVHRSETLLHGTPSGVDNTVIAYERAVWFTRGQPIEFVRLGAPLHLVIADSGAASRTKDTVAAVRALHERNAARVDDLCQQIGALVRAARLAAVSGDLNALGQAMNANHPLLQALGVSTPQLDALVSAAQQGGALGAKLTGGGGGGCIVALAAPVDVAHMRAALLRAGAAKVFTTTVPVDEESV